MNTKGNAVDMLTVKENNHRFKNQMPWPGGQESGFWKNMNGHNWNLGFVGVGKRDKKIDRRQWPEFSFHMEKIYISSLRAGETKSLEEAIEDLSHKGHWRKHSIWEGGAQATQRQAEAPAAHTSGNASPSKLGEIAVRFSFKSFIFVEFVQKIGSIHTG